MYSISELLILKTVNLIFIFFRAIHALYFLFSVINLEILMGINVKIKINFCDKVKLDPKRKAITDEKIKMQSSD